MKEEYFIEKIIIYSRQADDDSIYWTAISSENDKIVGGGDTPEEALTELQENIMVLIEDGNQEKAEKERCMYEIY